MTLFSYPILERRNLSPAEKARWFSRKTRRPDELPRPDAHQSLVYRVGSDLVLDDDLTSPADERIVNATNVSVVDMRRDALVEARLEIPSADASHFDVGVTFRCTVDNAVAVVSGGVNAVEVLEGHLKAHSRIFELGLDYKLTQVNEVRRLVSAQVRAYLTHVPARVAGMQVRFANVEVGSPKELSEFEGNVRRQDFASRLDWQEMEYLHRKEAGKAVHSQALESRLSDHEIDLDGRRHQHDLRKASAATSQDLEADSWKHAQRLQKASADVDHELDVIQRRGAVARSEFDHNVKMIDGDPKRALLAAYAAGQLNAEGLSAGLKAIDDSLREQAIQSALQEREEQRALQAAKIEEQKIDRDWQREKDDRQAAEKARQDERDREDATRREREAREDKLAKEAADRDDARRVESMRFEMVKQMAAKGHFNTSDLQSEALFAEAMHMPPPGVEGSSNPAVGRYAMDEIESSQDRSGGVREEDE